MNSFDNNDPFKHFVKSKLADYKQDVPPSSWENLESSLFAEKKVKVIHTKWLVTSLSAVAAALIGVFFLFQNMNNELPIHTAEYKTPSIITPASEEETPKLIKQNSAKITKPAPALFSDNTSSVKQKTSATIETIRSEEPSIIVSADIINENKKKEFTPNTLKEEQTNSKDKLSELDEETKQQMLQDFIDDGKRTYDGFDDARIKKNKSKFAVSLSGRSAFASSQQSSTLPTTLRSSLNDTYGDFTLSKMQAYTEGKDVNSESKISHRQPLSFGLLTSFDITKKLQIETGLVYTFLSSETENMSTDFSNTEKQQFHYLGIPINLNYTLFSANKLNLFVTAGAMIEKDIYGKIKYNDEKTISSITNSGYANETSSKINQNKPQFSIATGVGITYPIYNKAHLFGKIGGRYYINANNEFKTYYSDEKFGLDIQLGIKFNF